MQNHATVRQTLAALATEDHRLHVRHAMHEGEMWIDLDGHRAIRVRPGGWEIVTEPPIMFRCFPHQRPLPDPVPGGDPWEIERFVNLKSADDLFLLLAFLVAAMVPDIPTAALILHGVQGSAKTTLLKLVKRHLDPSRVEVRGSIKDPASLRSPPSRTESSSSIT